LPFFYDTICKRGEIVKISKTLFKELIRCKSYYGLNKLYEERKKVSFSNASFSDLKEYLGLMIDKDDFSDKLEKPIEEWEQEQFQETEAILIKYANKLLKTEFLSGSLDKQKKLKYIDQHGNIFYTKVDGYQETKDEIIILEAKAKSSKDFVDQDKYFKKDKSFLTLLDISETDGKKAEKEYLKFLNNQVFNPGHKTIGRYIYDGLYTYFLATKNNPHKKKITFYMALLNNEYVLDLNKVTLDDPYPRSDGGEIVVLLDMSKFYQEFISLIEKDIENIQITIQNDFFIEPEVGVKCRRKDQKIACLFCPVCFDELLKSPGSALYFYRTAHHKFGDILAGKTTMDMYDDSELSPINQIQKQVFVSGKQYIDKEAIRSWLDKLVYPIYHLDFEGFQSPLPRFQGEKPYDQSVFQFSLHTEKAKNALKDINDCHYSFLVSDFEDHREECAKALVEKIDLTNGGTVLTYNQNYEKLRIKELAELYPQYREQLLKIKDHIVDLLDVFVEPANGGKGKIFFYDTKLKGSFSIKKVLPVFVSELSYQDLEVQHGMMAQAAYYSFKTADEEDLAKIRHNLEEYCKLDTWSMAAIVHALSKI